MIKKAKKQQEYNFELRQLYKSFNKVLVNEIRMIVFIEIVVCPWFALEDDVLEAGVEEDAEESLGDPLRQVQVPVHTQHRQPVQEQAY